MAGAGALEGRKSCREEESGISPYFYESHATKLGGIGGNLVYRELQQKYVNILKGGHIVY